MKLLKLFTWAQRWIPRWVASAVVTGGILWLTLAPHPVGDTDLPLFPGADKIVHACMFGALALALWFDAGYGAGHKTLPSRCTDILCAASALSLGILTELLQAGMGLGRSFEWVDILADASGALLALYIMLRARP